MSRHGADLFQAFAFVANHHGFVAIALDDDGGGNAHHARHRFAGLFGELVDDDGGGVGQLVTREAEQFFSDDFAGQKLLAAIGEFVFAIPPSLLGQVFLALYQQALNVFRILGRHRHKLGKRMFALHLLQPRCQLFSAVHFVELVGHQHGRNVFAEQGHDFGICGCKAARIHDKQHQVHITHRTQHGFVERAVQGIAMGGLKTRGVDKNELGLSGGSDAGDAVSGGLRFARGEWLVLRSWGVFSQPLQHGQGRCLFTTAA